MSGPFPSCETSSSWRRPGRFLPGKEQVGELGGADTPHQAQWLIAGVRAKPHVHRFPGDPGDKSNIRDSTKPSGRIWQQRRCLPPFYPCPFLEGQLTLNSAVTGHRAQEWRSKGGEVPAVRCYMSRGDQGKGEASRHLGTGASRRPPSPGISSKLLPPESPPWWTLFTL